MAGVFNLGSLLVHIRADATQYQATMGAVQKSMIGMQAGLTSMGMKMSTMLTLPLALIGGASVKAFANFNSEMTKSLAIMGDVDESTKKRMETTVRDLAQTTTTSATQMAEAYFFLASAGLDAEQSMAAMAQVEKFSVAGQFDMATATDLATDAQSALGLTVKDATQNLENMTKVTDILVGANTLANASTEQFSLALTSGAGTAMKNYNIELEQGVAVLAAYADQGIKAQTAGHLFSRMIRLTTMGFAKNKQAWKAYGIDIYDTTGQLKDMSVVIGDLSAALGPMSTEMKVSALDTLGFKARSAQAILPLLGLGDRVEEYTQKLREMNGVTKETADKQLKSFSSQLAITGNQFKEMGIQIGEILAPKILWFNQVLRRWINNWDDMSEPMKRTIVNIGLIVAALGPLLLILGMVMKAAIAFTAFLGTTFGAVVVAAGIAIIALISIIQDLRAAMDETGETEGSFLSKWINQFEIIQIAGAYMAATLLMAVENIKYSFNQTMNGLKLAWEGFQSVVLLGVGKIVEEVGKMLSAMEAAINKIPDWMRPGSGDVDFGGGGMQLKGIEISASGVQDVIGAMEVMEKETQRYNTATEAIGQGLGERLTEIEEQFSNPTEKAKESIASVQEYQEEVMESIKETAGEQKTWLENHYEDIGKKFDEWGMQSTNIWGNFTDVAINSLNQVSAGITEMLTNGEFDFRAWGQQVIKQLINVLTKALMVYAIMMLFPGLMPIMAGMQAPMMAAQQGLAAGNTAAAMDNATNQSDAMAGQWTADDGSMAMAQAGGGVWMSKQPSMHTGGIIGRGPLKSDERVIVGQDGEVMISKEDISAAANRGGSDNSVTTPEVNIINVLDKKEMITAMATPEGEQVIVNVMRRNQRVLS